MQCNRVLSGCLHDCDAVLVIVKYPENWRRLDIRPAVTVEAGVEERRVATLRYPLPSKMSEGWFIIGAFQLRTVTKSPFSTTADLQKPFSTVP